MDLCDLEGRFAAFGRGYFDEGPSRGLLRGGLHVCDVITIMLS